MIAAAGRLIRIVDFMQVCGVIGIKDCGVGIAYCPDNAILIGVRRDAGTGSRVSEGVDRLGYRSGEKLCVFELKFENRRA